MTPQIAMRHDIDGLRAIAVIIVMLYHAGLSEFGGGFVGVDVFFVISGFLILPPLVARIAAGDFSFGDFMARRVRRLVPAVLPVLAYTFALAALVLGAGAFDGFLDGLTGAALFVSNYVFLGQSGYFERTNDTLLLLHTWSLGVEFQFYLLAPFAVLLARGRAVWMLGLLALTSLAYATYLVETNPSRAFYGVLPRLWELALGGLIGLALPHVARFSPAAWMARALGVLLILYAASQYKTSMPFPGLAALVPVLGAALVIGAPTVARDPLYRLLSSRVLRWIGTRSYSLYLWHWPLIVTVTLLAPHPTDALYLGAVALAFPLAEASYRLIETPVRRAVWWRAPRRTTALFVAPAALLLGLWVAQTTTGALSTLRQGLPLAATRALNALADHDRAAYLAKMLADGTHGETGICSLDDLKTVAAAVPCFPKTATPPVLVIGDSHGRDMFNALKLAFPGTPFVLLHQSGCAPAQYDKCFRGLTTDLPALTTRLSPRLVILASHWPSAGITASGEFIDQLAMAGLPTALIGPGPVFETSTVSMLRRMRLLPADLTAQTRLPRDFRGDGPVINTTLHAMADAQNIPMVDRLAWACTPEDCAAFLPGDTAQLILWDNQHLTLPAIRAFGNVLRADPALSHLLR